MSWFIARRNNRGVVTTVKSGMSEEAARAAAGALNEIEMYPVIDLTSPFGPRVTCPRWLVHWSNR